jgi:glycosyltransferase involved in cell wall biosynthesis
LFIRSLGGGGGAERVMVNLARAFAGRGHRVDLVLGRAEGPFLREVPDSVRVVDLGTESALACLPALLKAPGDLCVLAPVLASMGAPSVLRRLPALIRYLRREEPTCMLSALRYSNITALCAVQLAGVRTSLAISEHNALSVSVRMRDRMEMRWFARLERRFYPRADAIIAVSNGVAEDLAAVTGLPRERVMTIYNPVVTPELSEMARMPLAHPWFAPGSPPVLLGVGKFKPQKDFPTLLKAFARVRATRPARLVILGQGKKRTELETLARKLGVAADVDLPGWVDNPFAWMVRAAVFVLSSAWEGLPTVLIEAMACGCPVVSTDCPSGPAEILDGGVYGPLVPVRDDAELARAILSVLETSPDPEKLRARAALFSVERATDQYLQVLSELGGLPKY